MVSLCLLIQGIQSLSQTKSPHRSRHVLHHEESMMRVWLFPVELSMPLGGELLGPWSIQTCFCAASVHSDKFQGRCFCVAVICCCLHTCQKRPNMTITSCHKTDRFFHVNWVESVVALNRSDPLRGGWSGWLKAESWPDGSELWLHEMLPRWNQRSNWGLNHNMLTFTSVCKTS